MVNNCVGFGNAVENAPQRVQIGRHILHHHCTDTRIGTPDISVSASIDCPGVLLLACGWTVSRSYIYEPSCSFCGVRENS